jgi:hypothetical protein
MSTLADGIRGLGPPYVAWGGNWLLPLAAAALALAVPWLWSGRPARDAARRRGLRRAWWVAAFVVAATSVASYFDFLHWPYRRYVNPYEHFHYYLGAKYAPELGYDGLYEAALVADAETGRLYRPANGALRDLSSNLLVPVPSVLAEAERVRARFPAERWREFVGDVAVFRDRLGPTRWNAVLQDRGYNATPWWTAMARPLTRLAPASDPTRLLALALLDVALLVLAVVAIARTFGGRAGILAIALFGSFYFMAHAHMKGAFLRTDFAVALVLSLCALASGRAALAGLFAAHAVMSRLFPAAFLVGPASLAVWQLLSRDGTRARDALGWALRFFGALALGVLALGSLSVASAGDPGVWRELADKIADHRRLPHIWNVGFDAFVVADVAGRGTIGLPPGVASPSLATPALLADPGPVRVAMGWAVRAIALAFAFVAARGLTPHRALAFGFVPFFFLVAPTYYYYVVILMPLLFFAERLERPAYAAGVAAIYLMGGAGFAFYGRWDQYFATTFWSTAIALGLAAYTIAVAMRESAWRASRAGS